MLPVPSIQPCTTTTTKMKNKKTRLTILGISHIVICLIISIKHKTKTFMFSPFLRENLQYFHSWIRLIQTQTLVKCCVSDCLKIVIFFSHSCKILPTTVLFCIISWTSCANKTYIFYFSDSYQETKN